MLHFISPHSISIYGGGAHTRWLLSTVSGVSPAPRVDSIIDDGEPKTIPGFGSRTVRPADIESHPKLILISSDVPGTALRMMKSAAYHFPSAKIINLYDGCPKGQYV
jgi:hypothetical protein